MGPLHDIKVTQVTEGGTKHMIKYIVSFQHIRNQFPLDNALNKLEKSEQGDVHLSNTSLCSQNYVWHNWAEWGGGAKLRNTGPVPDSTDRISLYQLFNRSKMLANSLYVKCPTWLAYIFILNDFFYNYYNQILFSVPQQGLILLGSSQELGR